MTGELILQVVLVAALAIRIAALWQSIALYRRTRDRRVLVLPAIIGLTIPQEVLMVNGVLRPPLTTPFGWPDAAFVVVISCLALIVVVSVSSLIDDLRTTAQKLRASSHELETLTELSPVGVFRADPGGATVFANDRAWEIAGDPTNQGQGFGWIEHLHPDDRERVWREWGEAVEQRKPMRSEYRFGVGDDVRWVLGEVLPELGEDGEVVGYIGALTDISDRKEAEAARTLALRELDHRVKNAIATVQGVAEQTLSSAFSREEFAQTFRGRLQALGQMHEAMARNEWNELGLRSLVDLLLAPFASDRAARIDVDGEPLAVPVNSVRPIGMALYELATNATKYGSLSRPGGRVDVSWARASDRPAGWVKLRWSESGGPPVCEPGRRGFGTAMIQEAVPHELGGDVRLRFEPSGLDCEIAFPLDRSPAAGH